MRFASIAALGLVLGLSACTGSKPPAPDGGDPCTKALYDPCYTEHDCTSGICKNFMGAGSGGGSLMVCTVTCTAGDDTPCIVSGGQAGTCNAMGLCKPPAANTCHL